MSLLTRLRLASAFVLLWPLALYPAVLWAYARLRPRPVIAQSDGAAQYPSLTVIVPTYREIANIEARLENILSCEYPRDRLSVVVVDSASNDGTADAAERVAARSEVPVQVIREERRGGKAAATNTALASCASDLVLVTDAPTRFHPDALSSIAGVFRDPSVGAATGVFSVYERKSATQREEGLFWEIRNHLRRLEADVDSTPFLSGEFCCFRRQLIREIAPDSIADDMNAALQVRRQGYRAVVEPRALFTEPRSPDLEDLLRRKVSRAAGGIQELLRHRDMILNRDYGAFGLLILPSDMLYYVPVRLPAAAILVQAFAPMLWKRRLALAAFGLAVAALPRARRAVLDAAYVALLNEWLFAKGWQTVLTERTEVLWEQEPRAVVPDATWKAEGHVADE